MIKMVSSGTISWRLRRMPRRGDIPVVGCQRGCNQTHGPKGKRAEPAWQTPYAAALSARREPHSREPEDLIHRFRPVLSRFALSRSNAPLGWRVLAGALAFREVRRQAEAFPHRGAAGRRWPEHPRRKPNLPVSTGVRKFSHAAYERVRLIIFLGMHR